MSLQSASSRRWAIRIVLALICLLSFGFNLHFLEAAGAASPSPDEANYIAMARRLIEEHTYSYWGNGPDAYVTPVYPLFLAVCMKLFGAGADGLRRIRLLQALLSTGTVFLTYRLGKDLTGRDAAGLLAAGLIACNLTYAAYSCLLLTETLYFFLMMLFLAVFLRASRQNRLWPHLLSGALWAAAVLTRPLLAAALPFLWLPHILSHRGREDRKALLLPLGVFAAGALVLFLPWLLRNLVVLGRFAPFSTQSNPFFAGLAPDPEALGLQDPGTLLGNLGLLLSLLLRHPFRTLYWLTFEKFAIIFQTSPATPDFRAVTTLCRDFSVYVGLLGCGAALVRREHLWPALALLAYLAGSFLAVPTSRYALQYLPLLSIAAGYAVTLLWARPRPKTSL